MHIINLRKAGGVIRGRNAVGPPEKALRRRCIHPAALGLMLLLVNGVAQAVNYTFSGASRPACSGSWSNSGSTHTCSGSISLASGDTIVPASNLTVIAQGGITLPGSNTIGSASVSVSLGTTYGAFSSTGATIYGNVSTASGSITMVGTTLGGNITTSGTVNLTGGSVAGNVSSQNGVTASGSTVFNGSVTATNGSISLTGGSVSGSVHSNCCTVTTSNTNVANGVSSNNSTVTINGGTISGVISTSGGAGIILNNTTITSGSITATNVPISVANSNIGSAASPVAVTSNNTVTIAGGVIHGNVTAGSWQGALTINAATTTVYGVCTSNSNSNINPPEYPACATDSGGGGPHHFEIQSSSGAGVTCSPITLTIKACADAACAAYTNGVAGALSASGAPAVNWLGGTGFTIASGASSVTKQVQVTTPGSVTFGASLSGTTCNFGAPACTFIASDSGFLISAPDHEAETPAVLTIKAVKKADDSLSCTPAFASVSKTVNLKCAYVDPDAGAQPVRVGGSALNSGNDAGAACDGAGRSLNLSFDATGTATPELKYADVGRMQVSAQFTGASGTLEESLVMTGAAAFVVKPAEFVLSNIRQTAAPQSVNPAAADASGAKFVKAGEPFSATVTAVNALGNATPNFGSGTGNATEMVTLTHQRMSPSDGAPGALGGAQPIPRSSFSNGAVTVSNLSWSEVGVITLTAANDAFLGSALTTTGTSGNVGRFIPDHFKTEIQFSSGAPMACPPGLTCPVPLNGFVYSGQPFTVNVRAMNSSNVQTENYTHSATPADNFAKVVALGAVDAAGGAVMAESVGSLTAGSSISASSFKSGGTASPGTPAAPAFTFAGEPTSPTDVYVRASDTDGVTSLRPVAADSVEGGVKIVSGRVMLPNAYGSELLPLSVNAELQYYQGPGWAISSTDNRALTAGNVNIANCQGNTADPAPACKPIVSVNSVASFANGVGSITLNAPGAGNNGWAEISLGGPGWPAWLPSNTARTTFGIYRGNNNVIYLRERY